MDLALPIFFYIIAFLMFFFGLYEEREEKEDLDEELKADHLVVIFLLGAMILFFVAGICMMYVTEAYYSPVTDTVETTLQTQYLPLGWLGIGLAMISAIFLTSKVFEILGSIEEG